ncbi:MAG: ABC transporter [Caldivirga sp. CIS_19]|jgi:ABC-2 type transport system ATP-binding protein|nr:MAG: ABC transporter [Caldivirga sp. CIS_19]
MAGIAVSTRNLVKVYGGSVRALDDVSINVNRGEVFAVLGPNGAGKTTLMRILTTQLKPTSGEAYVLGYNVVSEGDKVRKVIGYVPQEFSVWTDLTGYENLLIYAKIYGIPRHEVNERIREVLEFMDLLDSSRRLVGTYSGGMIRRLEIATALLIEPEVLFLDEPTVGLDPAARKNVWDKLKTLKKELGVTIVFNSHYMDEVEMYADRLVMLNRGKVVAQGTVDELRKSVGGEVVELTVDDADRAVHVINEMNGLRINDVNTESDRNIVRIIVDNAEEALPIIITSLKDTGVRIIKVSMSRPTLDDAFLKYAGGKIMEEGGLHEARIVRTMIKRG